MGGLAFTLENPAELKYLKIKTKITELNINVLNNFIVGDVEIIYKKGMAVGAKFTRLAGRFEKVLSELILQKRGRS